MRLHLVDGRYDASVLDDVLQCLDAEVRDPDSLNLGQRNPQLRLRVIVTMMSHS